MQPATVSTDLTLKRTKETSGVDVSPSTMKTLPPAKKIRRRRQLFPCGGKNQCMCTVYFRLVVSDNPYTNKIPLHIQSPVLVYTQ